MVGYIKKPMIVYPEQYTAGRAPVKGVCTDPMCKIGNLGVHVHTIHNNQAVTLEPGDWVFPEPDGIHYYPVKQDIFESTYEKVNNIQ